MLNLYRAGLRLRREAPWGVGSELLWLEYGDAVIAFARGDRFLCIVNFGPQPVELPAGADVLLGSAALVGDALPQDTAVWLGQAANGTPSDMESSLTEHNTHQEKEREGNET
jgi:alpha-glucosidase